MVNNLINVVSLLVISYLYLKKKTEASYVLLLSLTILAPTLIIGSRQVNMAYLLTVWLVLLIAIEAVRDRKWPRLTRLEIKTLLLIFIISRVITIVAYTIGYVQNGTAGWSVVIGALAGNTNLSLLVVLLVYMGQQVAKRRLLPVMYRTAAIVALVNIVFYILQRFFFATGYALTKMLYMQPERSAPLLNMQEVGAFDRIFGTFFTPIVLGSTFLYFIAILIAWFLMNKQKHTLWPILAVVAVLMFIGINSFSKLIVLGVPLTILYFFFCLLFLRRSKQIRPISMRPFWIFSALSVLIFVFAYFTFPAELINVKRYYYGLLFEPFTAFSSRYSAPSTPPQGMIDSGEMPLDAGMTVGAFQFFLKYPIFGVGPVQIADEFMFDSQVIAALHDGGIFGAAGYLLFYLYTFISGFKRRNLMVLTLVMTIGVACLASATLNYRNTMPFIAFLILIASDQDLAFGPEPDSYRLSWLGRATPL